MFVLSCFWATVIVWKFLSTWHWLWTTDLTEDIWPGEAHGGLVRAVALLIKRRVVITLPQCGIRRAAGRHGAESGLDKKNLFLLIAVWKCQVWSVIPCWYTVQVLHFAHQCVLTLNQSPTGDGLESQKYNLIYILHKHKYAEPYQWVHQNDPFSPWAQTEFCFCLEKELSPPTVLPSYLLKYQKNK